MTEHQRLREQTLQSAAMCLREIPRDRLLLFASMLLSHAKEGIPPDLMWDSLTDQSKQIVMNSAACYLADVIERLDCEDSAISN